MLFRLIERLLHISYARHQFFRTSSTSIKHEFEQPITSIFEYSFYFYNIRQKMCAYKARTKLACGFFIFIH